MTLHEIFCPVHGRLEDMVLESVVERFTFDRPDGTVGVRRTTVVQCECGEPLVDDGPACDDCGEILVDGGCPDGLH